MNAERLPSEVPLLDRLSVPIGALALPARAVNLFKKIGISYTGQIVQRRRDELTGSLNFGVRTLLAVEQALGRLGLQFGMVIDGWTSKYADALDSARAREAAVPAMASGRPAPSELREALLDALSAVEARQRNVDMIAEYLGWDGKGGSTLEKSGAPHGLTRERVRQLVARALSRLEHRVPPAVLVEVLAAIDAKVPLSRHRAAHGLQVEGFSNAPFDPIGLIHAASGFRLRIGWEIPELADWAFLVHPGGDSALRRAAKAARRLSSARGCVDLYQLSFEAKLPTPYGALLLLQDFFDTQPGFEWLDRDAGWLWRPPGTAGARNRLLNNLRKLLAASPAVSLQEFRIGLRRNPRMGGFAPPFAILREICARASFATLDGDCVRRIEEAEAWDDVLGTSEAIIVDVLRRQGPVLNRIPFLNACLARGMLEGTFAMYTSASPVLWKPAIGLFALLGSEIPLGLVEEQQRTRPGPQPEALANGWTGEGLLYVAWQLNERRAASGTLYVPAAVQRLVQGEWKARSNTRAHGSHFPVLVDGERLSGLRPLFRRAGAEAGDVAVLWFDRAARSATVVVGTRELVDEAAAGVPALLASDQSNDEDDE